MQRFLEVEDVLRIVASFLDPEDLRSLTYVRPFREVALDELQRVCEDVDRLFGRLCTDRTMLPAGHEMCTGRPPADEEEFRAVWEDVRAQGRRVKAVVFHEGTLSGCVNCLYNAARALSERSAQPVFPNAFDVTATILTMRGLNVFSRHACIPMTITRLDITFFRGEEGVRSLARVLRGFPALERLSVETTCTNLTRVPLEHYTGLSAQLRVLHIVDSNPLTYDAAVLARFLGGHARLVQLSLNPAPERVGDRAQLPSSRCLEALYTQPHPAGYAPALERFAALLRFEPVAGPLPPREPNCVRVLNFGASRSCEEMGAVRAYVRHLFPNAKIRAESLGVAQINERA